MKYFEEAEKDIELLELESKLYISQIPFYTVDTMMESGENNIFAKLIEKLRSIVETVSKKVKDFINSITIKKKMNELDEQIKKKS